MTTTLDAGAVHVWRVRLDAPIDRDAAWRDLSAHEHARAQRFVYETHRRHFVAAHAALRRVLARYVGAAPSALRFGEGARGKPFLVGDDGAPSRVEFNLSHSGDLALVAVADGRPVGVDVERWDAAIEHRELAEHFFSPHERSALAALAEPRDVVAGFFAAWSRKEAYLKATGHGIARGLHHFDVALHPGEPARLIADRLDPAAPARWRMEALHVADGYSAALVAAAPVASVTFLDEP